MSDPYVAVVMGADQLKRGNPGGYELFLKSVEGLASNAVTAMLAAPPEFIFQAQGKAQALAELYKKLEECTTLSQTYRTRT